MSPTRIIVYEDALFIRRDGWEKKVSVPVRLSTHWVSEPVRLYESYYQMYESTPVPVGSFYKEDDTLNDVALPNARILRFRLDYKLAYGDGTPPPTQQAVYREV